MTTRLLELSVGKFENRTWNEAQRVLTYWFSDYVTTTTTTTTTFFVSSSLRYTYGTVSHRYHPFVVIVAVVVLLSLFVSSMRWVLFLFLLTLTVDKVVVRFVSFFLLY
mmetsp:Transcript_41265/g.47593  ORF Transcript_41265/g.47593 Transcript_41265/m.47593 type:complete len:108 (+) Transcript_41265:142-465(+)